MLLSVRENFVSMKETSWASPTTKNHGKRKNKLHANVHTAVSSYAFHKTIIIIHRISLWLCVRCVLLILILCEYFKLSIESENRCCCSTSSLNDFVPRCKTCKREETLEWINHSNALFFYAFARKRKYNKWRRCSLFFSLSHLILNLFEHQMHTPMHDTMPV